MFRRSPCTTVSYKGDHGARLRFENCYKHIRFPPHHRYPTGFYNRLFSANPSKVAFAVSPHTMLYCVYFRSIERSTQHGKASCAHIANPRYSLPCNHFFDTCAINGTNTLLNGMSADTLDEFLSSVLASLRIIPLLFLFFLFPHHFQSCLSLQFLSFYSHTPSTRFFSPSINHSPNVIA